MSVDSTGSLKEIRWDRVPLRDRDTQPPGQQPCGRWHLPSAKAKHPALWRLDMWRSVASHPTGCDSFQAQQKRCFSMANCENGHWVQPWPKTPLTAFSKPISSSIWLACPRRKGWHLGLKSSPCLEKKSPFAQEWSVEKKTSPSCWSVFSVMFRWRITASSLGASCNWIFVGMFWKQKFDSRCRPETIMATFNEADDFNVTFNLSEKYKNSKRSKATLIDMSICVPLSHCRPLLWPPSLCQHQQRSSGMAGLDQTWWHTPHG